MPELKINLFGTFQVLLDNAPISTFESNKVRALLAYLAVEYDRVHRREAVAELLWPDWPKQSSLRNLSYALADLRKNIADHAVQPSFLLITRDSLGINLECNAWIDVRELTTGLSMPMTSNPPESVIKALEQAVKLASGPLLEGFSLNDSPAFETWLLTQREHYIQLVLETLDRLVDYHLAQRGNAQAEKLALRQIQLEPTHEKAHQQLMRLLYYRGDRLKALSQYENLQRVLRQEMDVEPSTETVQLYRQIRLGNLEDQIENQSPIQAIHLSSVGTYTFLFTDIEGSTRLFQDFPNEMPDALSRHNQIIQAEIQANHGSIFQIVGDGINAAFPTASDALISAVNAQRALLAEDWGPFGPLLVRMGLHTGTADYDPADTLSGQFHGYLTLTRSQRILACGHGSQILLSQAVVELLGDPLPAGIAMKDLGEHQLKGLAGTQRIYQVIAADLPQEFPPLHSTTAPPNNLPIQMTSFIGRKQQIADIVECLDPRTGSVRCLTLVGPGGCGKTRLALEAASEMSHSFPDGIWLVDLAPVTEPNSVPKMVIGVLGLREDGKRSPLKVLTDYLGYKKLLLILDNCEHLVDPCALMTEIFLQAAPDVRILSTSREAFGIYAEKIFRVSSLQFPEKGDTSVSDLIDYEAIQLFVQRARAVFPEFSVTDFNGVAVAQVCRRLEGIPLAIELAAAWTPLLRVEQIVARLDDVFHFLTGGSRVAMPRQQTLRATLDWSYNLLGDPEKTLLTQLSVFTAGFRLDAAEAVCAGDVISGQDFLAILYRLVKKSLVNVERIQGMETRYRLLETTRQYASEKLEKAGGRSDLYDRHLNYHRLLAEETEAKLRIRDRLTWMKMLKNEQENLTTALDWAFSGSSTERTEQGLRLAIALGQYWLFYGLYKEGRTWLEAGLAQLEPGDPRLNCVRAKALCVVGVLTGDQGELTRARQRLEESIAINKECNDLHGMAVAQIYLGKLLSMSDIATACDLVDQSLTISRQEGNMGLVAWALVLQSVWYLRKNELRLEKNILQDRYEEGLALYRQHGEWWDSRELALWLADIAYLERDYARASGFVQEVYENSLQRDDKSDIFFSLTYMANLSYRQEEFSRMETILTECIPKARELGSTLGEAWILRQLGTAVKRQSQLARAAKFFLESLSLAETHDDIYGIHSALAGMAGLAALNGQAEVAVRMLGAVEALSTASTKPLEDIELTEFERDTGLARSLLDNASFERMWAEGGQLSLNQIIDEVRR